MLQQPTLVTAWPPYISCLHEVDLDCHFRVTFLKKLVFEPLLSIPRRPFIRLSHIHDDRLSIYPGNTAVSKIFSCCQPSSLIFLKLNLYWGGCGRKFGENNGYLTWHSHYSALWRLGKCPPGWISWKFWVWVVYRMRISKIYIHVINYYEKTNRDEFLQSLKKVRVVYRMRLRKKTTYIRILIWDQFIAKEDMP